MSQISCTNCGVCCMHLSSPPFSDPKVFNALPNELRQPILDWMDARDHLGLGDENPCLWFDIEKRQCKHYEHRPRVCREFKMGSKDCLATRENAGITIDGKQLPMKYGHDA